MLEKTSMIETNEELLFRKIRKVSQLFQHKGHKLGQRRVITTIYRYETITQRELMEKLEVQAGSLSEILGKIEAEGWIIRQQNAQDKRNIDITLTESGKRYAIECIKHRRAMIRDLFENYSEEEKQNFENLLDKLIQNWEKMKSIEEGRNETANSIFKTSKK